MQYVEKLIFQVITQEENKYGSKIRISHVHTKNSNINTKQLKISHSKEYFKIKEIW